MKDKKVRKRLNDKNVKIWLWTAGYPISELETAHIWDTSSWSYSSSNIANVPFNKWEHTYIWSKLENTTCWSLSQMFFTSCHVINLKLREGRFNEISSRVRSPKSVLEMFNGQMRSLVPWKYVACCYEELWRFSAIKISLLKATSKKELCALTVLLDHIFLKLILMCFQIRYFIHCIYLSCGVVRLCTKKKKVVLVLYDVSIYKNRKEYFWVFCFLQ